MHPRAHISDLDANAFSKKFFVRKFHAKLSSEDY